MIAWKATDPDTKQFGRQINSDVFEFKEYNPYHEVNDEGRYIEMTIILSDYTEEEKSDHISAYYDSLEHVKEIYGDQANWIIAECIFEQESGLY